jgi:hypothetical protein
MTIETQYRVERALVRQLAQVTPTVTAALSAYTPGDGVQATIKRVFIKNTAGGDAAFDLFHDDDGTTYDGTTQLYGAETVTAGATRILIDELYVDSNGNIAVATDVSSALTFTFYGEEAQVRAR